VSRVKKNRLILREEAFGGIIFSTEDGTMVEVDSDAFRFLKQHLEEGREPSTDEEKAFLSSLKGEMVMESSERKAIANKSFDDSRYSFSVLSAPTLVDFMITKKCFQNCPHCYANASEDGAHVRTDDIYRVIDEISELGVFQLALGGGEPTLHPDFTEILKYSHDKGVVPNLTTCGAHLDHKILTALKSYAGAVGLSLEGIGDDFDARRKMGFKLFLEAIEKFRKYEIPTVLQITLSKENFGNLSLFVDFCLTVPDLYGVIFLAFKPVGRGKGFNGKLLEIEPEKLYPDLRAAFLRLSEHTRVGYDVCLTPSLSKRLRLIRSTIPPYLQKETAPFMSLRRVLNRHS